MRFSTKLNQLSLEKVADAIDWYIKDQLIAGYFEWMHPSKVSIVEQDWDNLIILDACRYDAFVTIEDDLGFDGELQSHNSQVSGTPEFLAKNFENEICHDIVYATANSFVNTNLDEKQFHKVIPVWKDGWDDDEQTVLPETMADWTLDAAANHTNKRIIAHFVQPHTPFVGKKRLGYRSVGVNRERALGNALPDDFERSPNPFDLLKEGTVSRAEVWEAYMANLRVVLPTVRRLVEKLDGKTVITADHGEAFGEHAWPFPVRMFGHFNSVHIPALTKVPWFECDYAARKEIEAEPPEESKSDQEYDDEMVSNRLQALGYKE